MKTFNILFTILFFLISCQSASDKINSSNKSENNTQKTENNSLKPQSTTNTVNAQIIDEGGNAHFHGRTKVDKFGTSDQYSKVMNLNLNLLLLIMDQNQ